MIVESITTGSFYENVWIVGDEISRDAIIIDPGDEANLIISKIEKLGLIPIIILATHAHPDHIGAAAEIQRRCNIPFAIHSEEKSILDSFLPIAQLLGFGNIELPKISYYFADGQILEESNFKIEVIHTPGHTPGSVCFLMGEYLFAGDTIFSGSVGRVDIPGGSWNELEKSLKKISGLPDKTILCSGHGQITTLEKELSSNPYLKNLK